MDKTATISLALVEEIFQYLIKRPYFEVAGMVNKLHMEVNQPQSSPTTSAMATNDKPEEKKHVAAK